MPTTNGAKISIDTDACTMCETCINGCPINNFKIWGKSSIALGDCNEITCSKCEHECPSDAITIS